MELVNHTGWPVKWLAGSTGEREMLGIAVIKATWRVVDGRLQPADTAEHWPVFDKPFVIADASFGVELDHRKVGADLVVIGSARALGGKPVTQMEVSARCGALHHRTTVIGDRRWERSWGRVRATPPLPFAEMPLGNDRAYGGQALFEGQPLPHAINPTGRGYHASKEDADGKPLPNLERPGRLIEAWTDQPLPACWFKPQGPMELSQPGDPLEMAGRMMESSFNLSVPELIAKDGALGERLLLQGFSSDGDLDLPLPPAQGPTGHVQVGALKAAMPSRLSTVVVVPDARAVVGTYHCLFRYLMSPRDRRTLELRWTGGACA
jgi:hypothetical protein